jgi:O-antigen ligase
VSYRVQAVPLGPLFALAGSTVAIFVAGTSDTAALAAVVGGAGIALIFARPTVSPGRIVVSLTLLLAASMATALLPAGASLPDWRLGVPSMVPLAGAFAAMPAHHEFWWTALAGTIVFSWAILAAPSSSSSLRIFLHAAAAVVAVYACVSIVDAQTAWTYPFSGGANFGLLPNRNHTAALLVVGSLVSFGLMQWEVVNHHRVGAVMSALWGAPSLAALLFFSTSRAGVVFLAVGFVLWVAGATGQAIKRRTSLAAALILTGFLAVLLVAGGSTVRDRLGALWQASMVAGGGQSGTIDFRQPVFRDTWQMIRDAPLTGQGLGHFEYVFPHYRDLSRTASRVLHPESDWLMVAAESGLPSLLILLVLAGWYFARCWHSRRESGGLLRWTVASAVGAVLAHGIVDVPWHRPALGWFVLVVALVAVPPARRPLRRPHLWRGIQLLSAILFIAVAVWLGRAAATGHPAQPYRWPRHAADLFSLLEAREYAKGELAAREAIHDFPLHHHGYQWFAGLIGTFFGTESEMEAATAAGRFVEPVLPAVAADQAALWIGIDGDNEAEAWAEAMRRALLVDLRSNGAGESLRQLDRAMRATRDRPDTQGALRDRIAGEPHLLAGWLRSASAPVVEEYLAGLGSGLAGMVDRLPAGPRMAFLQRWITLPSASAAAAYMTERNTPPPGPYWRLLAAYYAGAGDKPRAVAMVAAAEGFSPEGRLPDGEFARQLADLEAQGNTVAVRRLVREATEAARPDPEELRLAVIWYARAADWDMAWKAASRLATAREKGH